MSIQDDIFDLNDHFVNNTLDCSDMQDVWRHFRDWACEQERDCAELQIQVNRLHVTVDVLTEKLAALDENGKSVIDIWLDDYVNEGRTFPAIKGGV